MNQQYQVEKLKAAVTLYLVDGQERTGVMFLSPCSMHQSGAQTLAEVLREPDPFVPFVSDESGFLLINKAQISHLRYEPVATDMPTFGTPIEVTVTFTNSRQLSGVVLLEVPEGKARLQDFMNSNSAYFSLDCGDAFYLVNPAVIIEIAPIK
jgi:hypothetical protein